MGPGETGQDNAHPALEGSLGDRNGLPGPPAHDESVLLTGVGSSGRHTSEVTHFVFQGPGQVVIFTDTVSFTRSRYQLKWNTSGFVHCRMVIMED